MEMHLSRELIVALAAVIVAAFLLLAKAFSIKEESERPAPPTREEQLRAARETALRQIDVLRNPMRGGPSVYRQEQMERLQAIVTEIDAELKS
jgi:hypothetical protein